MAAQGHVYSVQDLLDQIEALRQTLASLTDQVTNLRAERGAGGSGARGGMYDKKTWEPDKLQKTVDFREWSDDFWEYIDQCDEQLSDMLNTSRDTQETIRHTGNDDETRAKAKVLYRVMKRYITNADARSLVVHVQDKNPYEAWRLLFMKYDPRNDHSAEALVAKINDGREWFCKKLSDVPVSVTRWEDMQREHLTRTGEEALTTASKRHKFKMMLPDDVRRFLEVQTMLQPMLTYDTMKGVVMNLVQRTTGLSTPMDTNSLEPGSESPTEPVDSFGRKPNPTNAKPGKGDGKGGAGKGDKGKGAGEEKRACHNCDRVGHIAKDCWRAKRTKGFGKGHDAVGRKDRGKDGKWYRKTGINSYELEEDQQDVGTWSPDSGSADCGSLTECDYNDGLGSSFFDDDTGFVGINSFENDLCQDCVFDSIMGFEEDFKGDADMEIAMDKFVAGYVAEVQPVQDKMAVVDDDEDAMQEGDAWSDYLLLQ